jgi:hypothetical protein
MLKMDEDSLITVFCSIDDFCQGFEPDWNRILLEQNTSSNRWWTTREPKLLLSELMTIAVLFHSSGFRTFKDYYLYCVLPQLKPYFPKLVSYKHFNNVDDRKPVPQLVQELFGKVFGDFHLFRGS